MLITNCSQQPATSNQQPAISNQQLVTSNQQQIPNSNMPFQLTSPFSPTGDQPEAIQQLIEGLENGLAYQTLLGVTGQVKLLLLLM